MLRRVLTGEPLLTEKEDDQGLFGFIECDVPITRYEYDVLATSTEHEILTLAQLGLAPFEFLSLMGRLTGWRQTCPSPRGSSVS